MTDVLLTCPPMILQVAELETRFLDLAWNVHVPDFTQTMSEEKLIELVPRFEGWIIGDDPASARVVEAGRRGRLRAAVKWGVGTDNLDFEAFSRCRIPVTNTPGMFGAEVADVALGYVIGLARRTFEIHVAVRTGDWPKPAGISLAGRTAVLVGFGDIGRNIARRLVVCGVRVVVCDPALQDDEVVAGGAVPGRWPECLRIADFVVLACALTPDNRHMLDAVALSVCKRGIRVVNVARGPLIDEEALFQAQASGVVSGCALDVFESEPLTLDSPLRTFPANVFGSHNASNTIDAVRRTSDLAVDLLRDELAALPETD